MFINITAGGGWFKEPVILLDWPHDSKKSVPAQLQRKQGTLSERVRNQVPVVLIKVVQDWVWWNHHTATVLGQVNYLPQPSDPLYAKGVDYKVVLNIKWDNKVCTEQDTQWLLKTQWEPLWLPILTLGSMIITASYLVQIIYVVGTVLSTLYTLTHLMLTVVL